LWVEDVVTVSRAGWLSKLAGRGGRQAVLAMIQGTTREAAYEALPVDTLDVVPLAPGRAAEPWRGNVVALGDAAAHFEPLGWFNLDLAHSQLGLLLELMPGKAVDPHERSEFNRRATLMSHRIRDALGRASGAARSLAGPGPDHRPVHTARAAAVLRRGAGAGARVKGAAPGVRPPARA